jgi:hypothetical protein
MCKVIQLISSFLYKKKMPPFMKVHVHWMNLMRNRVIQKCQSFEILREKVARQRTHFFNNLTKTLCSMGSKCPTLWQATMMCKNNLAKKHVWLSIETHFGILWGFLFSSYKPKYSYTIIYEYETHHYHMNYLKLD